MTRKLNNFHRLETLSQGTDIPSFILSINSTNTALIIIFYMLKNPKNVEILSAKLVLTKFDKMPRNTPIILRRFGWKRDVTVCLEMAAKCQ